MKIGNTPVMRAKRRGTLSCAAASLLLTLLNNAQAEERWQLDSRRILLRKDTDQNVGNTCRPYPGKQIVLVAVDADFADFFDNWLRHAREFFTHKEKVVVVAEDPEAVPRLQRIKTEGPYSDFEILLPSERKASFVEADHGTTPFGTKGYNDLMHSRPGHLLNFVSQGCSVLFADADTIWLRNPFKDIAEAGAHDLYVIDDGKQQFVKGARGPQPLWGRDFTTLSDCKIDCTAEHIPNFCGGFMYAHPTPHVEEFVREWSERSHRARMKNEGNQRAFNQMVCKHFKNKETATFAVLPFDKYPPGSAVESRILAPVSGQHPPSMIHANWLAGRKLKVSFLKRLGYWNVSHIEGH